MSSPRGLHPCCPCQVRRAGECSYAGSPGSDASSKSPAVEAEDGTGGTPVAKPRRRRARQEVRSGGRLAVSRRGRAARGRSTHDHAQEGSNGTSQSAANPGQGCWGRGSGLEDRSSTRHGENVRHWFERREEERQSARRVRHGLEEGGSWKFKPTSVRLPFGRRPREQGEGHGVARRLECVLDVVRRAAWR